MGQAKGEYTAGKEGGEGEVDCVAGTWQGLQQCKRDRVRVEKMITTQKCKLFECVSQVVC